MYEVHLYGDQERERLQVRDPHTKTFFYRNRYDDEYVICMCRYDLSTLATTVPITVLRTGDQTSVSRDS